MTRRWFAAGTLVACLGVAACGGSSDTPASTAQAPAFAPVDPGQLENLLTMPGTERFTGVLPCADCAGVQTTAMLVTDPATGAPQIFELRETRLGAAGAPPADAVTTRGTWSIQTRPAPAPPVYRLVPSDDGAAPRLFARVSDTELQLLDANGQPLASETHHTLVREAPAQALSFPAGGAPAGAAASATEVPDAMVTDLASGWPVALRIGQAVSVRLTADRASGGRWSVRPGTDAGLARQGEVAYEPPTGSGNGIEVFRFTAAAQGQTQLTFDYRKGTDGEPLRTVSYPVTVR
ncbi:MAG: copper resistance protein NlpE N-terminal domain-containing protein [Vicinamibacterales bacterium]